MINADDYYGEEAFRLIYNYLSIHQDDDKYRYTMVGYHLGNTVTDNGDVARGVCEMNEKGELVSIHERTRIEKRDGGIAYTEDGGETWNFVPGEYHSIYEYVGIYPEHHGRDQSGTSGILTARTKRKPNEMRVFPAVGCQRSAGGWYVRRLQYWTSADKWYGVTYKEDKPVVVAAIQAAERRKDVAGTSPGRLENCGIS